VKRAMWVALLGASACVSLSCDRVLGIPERSLDARIACADGQCVCVGDFGDCDGDVDNGCETDTRSAKAHCGACGHDCLGGACADGRCQPVVVASLEEGVSSFALKEGILYASADASSDPSGFKRLDMRGPTPVPMETPSIENSPYGPTLHVGTKALILCDYVSVQSLSLETWAITSLFDGQDILDACAAGGGAVWWTSESLGGDPSTPASLSRVREDGAGGVTTEEGPSNAWGLVLVADEQGVYMWDDASGVLLRHPPDGSSPVPVPNTPPSGGTVLASDAKNIYLGGYDDANDNALFAVPRDGGAPVHLGKIGPQVSNGVTDAQYAYLADYVRATVSRVPLAGGEEEVIAAGQDLQSQHPLYVDERAVYWLGGDAVWRIAK